MALPRVLLRRLESVGVALTVYDVWRHLPEKQRQRIIEHGVRHSSRAARFVLKEGSSRIRKHRR
jgi:hypothetical protein